jgi:hypothetical protein
MSRPQGTWFRREPRKKSPVTSPGIDPRTSRLVAQCLNHYAIPGPLRESVPNFLFTSDFPTETLYEPLLFPMHATCPEHLIVLDLINPLFFGKEFNREAPRYAVFSSLS